MSESVTVICNDPLFRCRCVKDVGHIEDGDPVHACGEDICGGSWEWLDAVRFVVRSYPRPFYEGAVIPPPEDVGSRDGVPFIECAEDGTPAGMITARRGGIKFIRSPELGR